MSFWSKFGRLFTVDDTIVDEDFSLLDEPQQETGQNQAKPTDRVPSKRVPFYQVHDEPPQSNKQDETQKDDKKQPEIPASAPVEVTDNLELNRKTIESMFHLPKNADVIIREFLITDETPLKAFAVFMEGLSDKTIINSHVLEPLMLLAVIPPDSGAEDRLQMVKEKLLPGNQVMEYEKWEDVKKNILSGSTAVFVEGMQKALCMETKGWEHRSVSDTKTESVVRGPHDAFTENLRSNTGLVRSRLRTEFLVTEMMQVGELAPTDIAVMYVDGIVNPRLIKEVKRRIKTIKVDFMQDSGILEQFIEDPPAGILPKTMSTERPDRVAAALSEGFVAIFVGQSPYALIVPIMFWAFLHTAEDAYLRYPFGTFIRLIRFVSIVIALLLPSLYIAVTNYHPEMIPTDLMLTIAASREKVPFPAVFELLMMEFSLELIREAGIRIPNVIGPTIGIVGALILGQAAVQAGIISPLLVIVVAVTALSSFTVPNYNFGFAIRSLRFVFIFLASLLGFYGIVIGFMALLMHFASMKSFGVPMFSPIAPYKPSSPDVVARGPVFKQERRPASIRPKNARRQRHITRPWDPTLHTSQEAQAANQQQQNQAADSDKGGDRS